MLDLLGRSKPWIWKNNNILEWILEYTIVADLFEHTPRELVYLSRRTVVDRNRMFVAGGCNSGVVRDATGQRRRRRRR